MELHIYPLSIAAENRIGITNKQFDTAFPVKMKQIKGNKWTPEHQCWHIPYTKEAWQTFQQLFEGHTIIRKLSEVAKVAEPTGKLQETQPDEQAIESNTKLQETSINVQQVIELPTKLQETVLNVQQMDKDTATKIIARRCADKPDRIFISIPQDRIDWKIYMNQVQDSCWLSADKVWSLPRTQKLFKQFLDDFGDNLFIDKQTPIVLTETIDEVKTSFIQPKEKLMDEGAIVLTESKTVSPPQSFHPTQELPQLKGIKIEKILYGNQDFIGVHVHFSDLDSREKIKTIEGRLWHPQAKLWIVPYTINTYRQLQEIWKNNLEIISSPNARVIEPPIEPPKLEQKPAFVQNKHTFKEIDNSALFYKLNTVQQEAVTKLENLLIEERKAHTTRKGYRNIFIQFLYQHAYIAPNDISNEQLKAFIVKRIKEENISKSTQNQIISTFKAYYGRFLEQPDKVANLYRPDKEEHLPKTLTTDEITRLLKQIGNLKHKCMLMLMYGSGLRVGELVRLQFKDLDFTEKTVFVDTGKHYKDRFTIFSEKSITYLKKYLEEHKPKPALWVFESPNGGHYSERSVQLIFAEALAKAHIQKKVSTHSLRHTFATELLKSSSDLDFVRKVMGHASIETTQIYLHVIKTDLTRTRSPLDDLDI